jgi:hypothetical protein
MTKDPYRIVKCDNRNCSHMMETAYRHLKYPDPTTPKEKIHTLIDETLTAPLVYFCTRCNHFTIIAANEHIKRVLERTSKFETSTLSGQGSLDLGRGMYRKVF